MLISIRWYVSNKQWKEIAHIHTPLLTIRVPRKKDHFDTFLSLSHSLSLHYNNKWWSMCMCYNLVNVPVGCREIVVCYFNKKNCKVMLENIAMCVHLSVFVGDSTFIFWCVFDCGRMNMGVLWERYHPFDPPLKKRERLFPRSKWVGSM
jgi:hypothetical protein